MIHVMGTDSPFMPFRGLFYCLKLTVCYIVRHGLNLGCVMYLLKRLKEPSTWASLSAASAALASVPAFSAHALTASAVFAAIGILLKEQGNNNGDK